MQITVQLPDDLGQLADPSRAALEALAIEGFRSGALSLHQAGRLLSLSRLEFESLLKLNQVEENAYDTQDLQEDQKVFEELRSSGRLKA